MTNVEKLKIKAAELAEEGVKWNCTDYSALMGEESESPEDRAGSILKMIESAEDPDAWIFRTFTDENGNHGFEIKCKGEGCSEQFKVMQDDKNSRLSCPKCEHANAF